MKSSRSAEFNPLDRAAPLDSDQLTDFGVAEYSAPKVVGKIKDAYFVQNHFTMRDGWEYNAVSTVVPPETRRTQISGTMTAGWYTNEERGFNGRRAATLARHGAEFTSVSVPLNMNRLWGDMEANAYNQARIGRAMAAMLGRHPHLYFEDGLSRGAMTGESVIGVSPEVGADVIFGYNTVPCRINGVEEVADIAELVKSYHPIELGRAALRGDLPVGFNIPHVIRTLRRAGKGIGEAFGNELSPMKQFVTTPLDQIRNGATVNEAINNTIGKFHPDSIAVPYNILSKYPLTADVTPRRLFRQAMEAYTLTNGTYGRLADKVRPNQFQVITGFKGDGLSHFEEVAARHDPETHPNTIVALADGGRHLSVVIEDANRAWSERWKAVIDATAELGEKKIEDMAPSERSHELRHKTAQFHRFFAHQQHDIEVTDSHIDAA